MGSVRGLMRFGQWQGLCLFDLGWQVAEAFQGSLTGHAEPAVAAVIDGGCFIALGAQADRCDQVTHGGRAAEPLPDIGFAWRNGYMVAVHGNIVGNKAGRGRKRGAGWIDLTKLLACFGLSCAILKVFVGASLGHGLFSLRLDRDGVTALRVAALGVGGSTGGRCAPLAKPAGAATADSDELGLFKLFGVRASEHKHVFQLADFLAQFFIRTAQLGNDGAWILPGFVDPDFAAVAEPAVVTGVDWWLLQAVGTGPVRRDPSDNLRIAQALPDVGLSIVEFDKEAMKAEFSHGWNLLFLNKLITGVMNLFITHNQAIAEWRSVVRRSRKRRGRAAARSAQAWPWR